MNHPNLVKPTAFPSNKWRSRDLVPFVKRAPKPFRFIEPLHERAIVYPWLSSAAVWQELKYSLRSVQAHFTDRECPIYIIGDKAPAWLRPGGRVRFIEVTQYRQSKEAGLWEAWQQGMQIANEVAWWNDDIYLLRETGWEDMRAALTEGLLTKERDNLRRSMNGWRAALGDAVEELLARGWKDVWRFATHTPFLFEAEKSRAIMREFHLHHKGSWVTLYHNYHHTPHEPCAPHKTMTLPATNGERYLNHKHGGPGPALQGLIQSAFTKPAPWEK